MFEIHITTHELQEEELPDFVAFCRRIKVKPILIELEKGVQAQQPMISKVVRTTDKEELYEEMYQLGLAFEEAGYPVRRTKVEVPLEYIEEGEAAFPKYLGQYFEWHGKVEFTNLEELKELAKSNDAHLSNNSLKGQKNLRFLTVRTYGQVQYFRNRVYSVKFALKQHGYVIFKDEYEYCVYDSNKEVDKGWIDTPAITDHNYINLLAFEGFLRRLSRYPDKFMLKGSLVTRQYLADPSIRRPGDLDFVYFGENQEKEEGKIFSDWVTQITETHIKDGIEFDSFRLNDFWRGIDYAMNDDFPTVNTDLSCVVKGEYEPHISLDISWNLPFDEEPVPLTYKPEMGEPFSLPFTVPLSLQLSWKLHQSLVRPRQKDLMDIVLLLEHNEIETEQVERVAFHLIKECKKDGIPASRLRHYINGEVASFFIHNENRIRYNWEDYINRPTPFGFSFEVSFGLMPPKTFMLEKEYTIPELLRDFEKKLVQLGIADFLPDLPDDYVPYVAETEEESQNSDRKWWEFWKR